MYMHFYCIVPKEATMEEIETAVIKEYGGSLHKAIRGEGTEQQYMQHLLQSVMPYLIPADAIQSKWAIYWLRVYICVCINNYTFVA